MGEEDARDLLHQLEEAISDIERDEREQFVGLLKDAIQRGYEKEGTVSDYTTVCEVFTIIDDLLKEMAED